jgi:hypothetical protein
VPALCLPPFLLQVCKYIDIPLQHISNLTLLGMNRPPQAHTLALLHKLRERIPGLALRTTFISGFPGGRLQGASPAPPSSSDSGSSNGGMPGWSVGWAGGC